MKTNRQMKIRRALYIIVVLFMLAVTGRTSAACRYPKHEVRAVWLTTFAGLDWPHTKAVNEASVMQQKKELVDILDSLKKSNINTILFQTRVRATTLYPSAIEPWDACLTGKPGCAPGYDPLAFAVNECHKRGMEIQAWVVAMPVGKWTSHGCLKLRKRYPNLIVKRGDEGYINPANPVAAAYISSICTEITKKYDIDGIHLDYIRYPETWWPKHSRRKGGEAERRAITDIVAAVGRSIKSIKPWVKLSCAAIGKYSDLTSHSSRGWNAFTKGCQDAQLWMERGLVDQLYPMMYFRGNHFYPFAVDWAENKYGTAVAAGIGTYFLSPAEGGWPLDEIIRQTNVARKLGMGYAMFREKFLVDDVKGVYAYVKNELNPYPAIVPPMHNVTGAEPNAPSGLTVTTQGKHVTLSWLKNDTLHGGVLYNIYASRTVPVDIDDARNLVAVRTTANRITLDDCGQLYFAVTAVDRYGRESAPAFLPHDSEQSQGFNFLLACDGRTLKLPDVSNELDAEFIVLKSLTGTIVATRPYKGADIDVSRMAEGFYAVYSLASKGIAHRLGFTMIRRKAR